MCWSVPTYYLHVYTHTYTLIPLIDACMRVIHVYTAYIHMYICIDSFNIYTYTGSIYIYSYIYINIYIYISYKQTYMFTLI